VIVQFIDIIYCYCSILPVIAPPCPVLRCVLRSLASVEFFLRGEGGGFRMDRGVWKKIRSRRGEGALMHITHYRVIPSSPATLFIAYTILRAIYFAHDDSLFITIPIPKILAISCKLYIRANPGVQIVLYWFVLASWRSGYSGLNIRVSLSRTLTN